MTNGSRYEERSEKGKCQLMGRRKMLVGEKGQLKVFDELGQDKSGLTCQGNPILQNTEKSAISYGERVTTRTIGEEKRDED